MARKANPPEFAVIDCETDPFKLGRLPTPFAWGLRTRDSYWDVWGVGREDELIDELRELDPRTIVYAHNGGKFDFHFLTAYLDPSEPVFIMNGRLVRGRILDGPELRDSFVLIPEALASYQKTVIDYAKFEPGVREKHRAEIRAYLEDDCNDLFDLVGAFWKEHGPKLTLPQAAMAKWVGDFTAEKRPKSHARFDAKFRPFYYGGRVQCFEMGVIDEPLRLYDINSAYPWSMLGTHPIGTAPRVTRRLPSDPTELRHSFARIVARSGGCLPHRSDSGSLDFPSDNEARKFYATGHEILAGIETGTLAIEEVQCVWTFERFVSFKPFIMHYWKRRLAAKKKGDKLEDLVTKRTMNSLYGKFATNPDKFREHRIATSQEERDELESEGFSFAGFLGKWALFDRPRVDEWGFLNVATAASITGEVRAHLFRALCATPHPIYCDTDSIVARGESQIAQSKELGGWDLEATATRGAFAGKKLYALETGPGEFKTASKGVRLAADQIFDVARGEIVEHQSEVPTYRVFDVPTFTKRAIRRTGDGQLWAVRKLNQSRQASPTPRRSRR